MLPEIPGLASGHWGLLEWAEEWRGSGAGSLVKKAETWGLRTLTSMELGAGKRAAGTVTQGWVSMGSWDQMHMVGESSVGGAGRSLSQTLVRVSLRLARASWLPQDGRAGPWPSLPALGVTVVVMGYSFWPSEANSPIDEGLLRGLASSALREPSLSSRETLREILAWELAVASM